MAFTLTIRATAMPGRTELLALLDALAWSNARWFLAEHDAGREIPCCNDCGGLRYMPDLPSTANTFRSGAELLAAGVGSCGELAAFDVGRLRAKAILAGATVSQAGERAFVELEERPANAGRVIWHAVVRELDDAGRWVRKDPSAEKKAKAARG